MDLKRIEALAAPKRVKISNATFSYDHNQEGLDDASINPIMKRPKFVKLQN